MSHKIKERLKTVLIYILAITGLIQVGILWSYQNQGTPTSFLLELFNRTPQISDDTARKELFQPDRFILSDGSNYHWMIENTDDHYQALWDETSKALYKVANGKVGITKTDEKWADIIEKKSFMVDFGYTLKPDLLSWFFLLDETPKQFPDINKLLIKSDIVDKNSITLYIYYNNENVYVSDPIAWNKADELDSLIGEVTDNEEKYRDYRTFGGAKMGEGVDEPDVLYVMSAPKYWTYHKLDVSTFASLKNEEELARVILGNEKDRYTKSRDDSDTIQFGYGDNIYRYYNDGYLSYRNLGSSDHTGKDEVGKALLNAYKFIAKIRSMLNMPTELRLTSIEEKTDGTYLFGFDYRVDGLPVEVDIMSKDLNGGKLEHAISIQADSKRILKCDWLLKEMVKGPEGKYNDRLIDLLDLYKVNFKDLNIQDISKGYFVGSTDSQTLDPLLLIRQKVKDEIRLNMLIETGD